MTAQTTITVPAPKVQVGDLIDGRRVRLVTGRAKRSCTASYHSAVGSGTSASGKAMPSLTFSGHVVCIHFEDDGAPKYVFGNQTVEIVRP